jgi:hypothetical protein
MYAIVKFRHWLRRDKPVVAFGTGNLNREVIGTGYLFYDFDNGTDEQYRALLKQMGEWYGYNFFAMRTKHGVAVVSMMPEDFEHIHERFMKLKHDFPSDYLYDIPLFLRVSEKWGLDGKVVSTMPEVFFNPRGINAWEFFSKKCLPKKWYRTWD